MTFKEFSDWCNERARDGYWGRMEAITCIDILNEYRKIPFWKREKTWAYSEDKKFAEALAE